MRRDSTSRREMRKRRMEAGGGATGSAEPARSDRELRRFGWVMAAALAALAALLWWRGRDVWPWIAGLGGAFLVFGTALPRILAPVERAWMALGRAIGEVVSRVVLTVTFYLMITPIGLLMRALGNDPLELEIDEDANSYWSPVEPDGPTTRPKHPF